MFVKFIFWGSILLTMYTYVVYPLSLFLGALIKTKRIKKKQIFPQVTIVIAVFNEERHTKRKIENLLNQDYPTEKLELIFVSDGSFDKTEEIIKSFQSSKNKITLFPLKERRGKAFALNVGVSHATGEIIVFNDIRQSLKYDTVKQLVANFHDSSVGAVSGELFLSPEGTKEGEGSLGIYWEYEKWIRKQESQIDSCMGVTGAIYAIRKNLFEPVPEGTILDDVLIPMRIILKGFRVVFDETAKAYDAVTEKSEYNRKVRTMMGNFQVVSLVPEILSHRKNRLWVNYVSHKLMRLFVPAFLIATFITNLFMLNGVYLALMILQVCFYSAAIIGFLIPNSMKTIRLLSFSYTFVMLNSAIVAGFYHYLRNNRNIWVK